MVRSLVKVKIKSTKDAYECKFCRTVSNRREECCGRPMRKRYKAIIINV
jgi:hypothetical protein